MPLNLTKLLELIEGQPDYRRLVAELRGKKSLSAAVLETAKPYLVAALYRQLGRPVLLVTARHKEAQAWHEQLAAWLGDEAVTLLPEPDALPYERLVSDASTEVERVQALSALAGITDVESKTVPLVVASAHALMRKTPAYGDFAGLKLVIRRGMEVVPAELLRRLEGMGYRREGTVEIPGAMGQRGGIVDIYPPTSALPARLEFYGDTVESIRLYDTETQRSETPVPFLAVGPAAEVLIEGRASVAESLDLSGCTPEVREHLRQDLALLREGQRPRDMQFYAPLYNSGCLLDYLPPEEGLLILDGFSGIRRSVADLAGEAEQRRGDKLGQGELPSNYPIPYLAWEELEPYLAGKSRLELAGWDTPGPEPAYRLGFVPAPTYAGQLPGFIRKAKQWLGGKQRLVLVSQQARRLAELLGEADIIAVPSVGVAEVPPPGSLTLVAGSLAGGWAMRDTYLLTDEELFGFTKERRLVRRRHVPRQRLSLELVPGDLVVHVEHGVARFTGVRKLGSEGNEKEFLVLQYAAGDRLYVPADQMGRVSHYVGGGEHPPVLTRLGTQEWNRTKQKVKDSVAEVARELLALYASREVVGGHVYSPDTVWQQELEAAFPYVETPDQMSVQQEVKADMERPRPMDRLVCGDVGYGKTEVAVRAAFKAVMDGKQVAVLVPTTVLAEQHLLTFRRRMAAFPVRIEGLSRFRSHKEQQEVIESLAQGTVDIVIGTHRLIQKDVLFKDLGLLVVDEEQRFGVRHKEFLKKMRREVDVLTLSATPIPRTLHMALVGVRDMSVMETPPEDRLPIKTYVAEYNDALVREAVMRELERNGQVFFVHNRVESIASVASKLQELVPEARVAVAHGQMPEEQLEEAMTRVVKDECDVLVCTTIIESGLDLPNVNTLIVNQADRLGLTQLYQLRGRVGRGAELAYAYFLYDRQKKLTPVARKRLQTIYEATELGAGYTIAMKDLEIRGAGNLLGVRQSGNIHAVGFSLYTQLLAEAVEEQKARLAGETPKEKKLPPPTVDLPLPAYIPEPYVSDMDTRLALYQKLVRLDKMEQIEGLSQELRDRFGPLPTEVKNLLYALRIKILAAKAGIETIATEDGNIVLRRFEGLHFDPQPLKPILRDGIQVNPINLRLDPKRLGQNWTWVLEEVLRRVVG